ncbi:retrotransposon nucleocapsid protein [Trichosporon asahii var. asahii CBS 8904]|uniref:RNA-directed DNA polymerase n=1 Tax=Trichosporon asahii var. asahii (strain CBS 8904) TaxID=1220162 RepID=K1WKA7_TRIAC|nr:retrotransposon nucleocapsid protein [Trichosporon asahii var. asahii CBS 8904]
MPTPTDNLDSASEQQFSRDEPPHLPRLDHNSRVHRAEEESMHRTDQQGRTRAASRALSNAPLEPMAPQTTNPASDERNPLDDNHLGSAQITTIQELEFANEDHNTRTNPTPDNTENHNETRNNTPSQGTTGQRPSLTHTTHTHEAPTNREPHEFENTPAGSVTERDRSPTALRSNIPNTAGLDQSQLNHKILESLQTMGQLLSHLSKDIRSLRPDTSSAGDVGLPPTRPHLQGAQPLASFSRPPSNSAAGYSFSPAPATDPRTEERRHTSERLASALPYPSPWGGTTDDPHKLRSPSVPNPDKFSGDSRKVRGFVNDMSTYFRFHERFFDTDERKVEFATLNLTDDAKAWFGLPSSLVTDRGSLFTSRFWMELARLLGVDHRLSTAAHPQTDGQTEIVNKALEQFLRLYCSFAQTDWDELLSYAEFSYNVDKACDVELALEESKRILRAGEVRRDDKTTDRNTRDRNSGFRHSSDRRNTNAPTTSKNANRPPYRDDYRTERYRNSAKSTGEGLSAMRTDDAAHDETTSDDDHALDETAADSEVDAASDHDDDALLNLAFANDDDIEWEYSTGSESSDYDTADEGPGTPPSPDRISKFGDVNQHDDSKLEDTIDTDALHSTTSTNSAVDEGWARRLRQHGHSVAREKTTRQRKPIIVAAVFAEAPLHPVRALIDSAASRNFLDRDMARQLGFKIREKPRPVTLTLGDGRTSTITEEVTATILVGQGFEPYKGNFEIHKIASPFCVLGVPFFQTTGTILDGRTMTIKPRPNSSISALTTNGTNDRNTRTAEEDAVCAVLPTQYHDFVDVFLKSSAESLPAFSKFDHAIDFIPGRSPKFGPLYATSPLKARAIKAYLDDMLAKGLIRVSDSPTSSPVLFVPKKNGESRFCVDYRATNAITVKNRYPIPLIQDLLDRLSSAKVFTKIDLRGAYHLVRIRAGDEWKTAFRTHLYEYLVMPFGLCNAPATFQRLVNHVFHDLLESCVVVYLDDILIFSEDKASHELHVKEVLQRLRDNALFAKAEKCEFSTPSMSFLGYVISSKGVTMDPSKTSTIASWPYPRNAKDVQRFLGLANFYRHFIPLFAETCVPLYALLKKGTRFALTSEVKHAWDDLKKKIAGDAVLAHFDPQSQCVVETDASDYAVGAVLSQEWEGYLRPLAFASRKMSPAELNYPTHDKEFLAIVYAFEQWRHYLECASVDVQVYTDHRSLEYFARDKMLNRRQARWADFMTDFHFTITYRPGRLAIKPDALSRRPDYRPFDTDATSTSEELNPFNRQRVLHPGQFLNALVIAAESNLRGALLRESDAVTAAFAKHHNLRRRNRLWYYGTKIYVPDSLRDRILGEYHDAITAGHPGVRRTASAVSATYWWPRWREYVQSYVDSCDACQRTKVPPRKPLGLLRPLPVAERPWQHISCDFVGALPKSNGFNSILVFVDRFTKMAVFVPTTTSLTAEGFAKLFIRYVFCRFGLPSSLVTDRGSLFTSRFWMELARLLGVDHRLSTAAHPQTDGQTEIVNKALEQFLRLYCSFAQTDWDELLSYAEFSYNSAPQSAIRCSPYEALTGHSPRTSLSVPPTPYTGDVPAAGRHAIRMAQRHRQIREFIVQANQRYADLHNKGRRDLHFSRGDYVYLRNTNIKGLRPSRKLGDKYIGPLEVLEQVGRASYRLRLPPSAAIHPVFHVSLLKPAAIRGSPRPVPADLADDGPQPVSILSSRVVRGQRQWHVGWQGEDDPSWETDQTMAPFPAWPTLRDSYKPQRGKRESRARSQWLGWEVRSRSPSPVDFTPRTLSSRTRSGRH